MTKKEAKAKEEKEVTVHDLFTALQAADRKATVTLYDGKLYADGLPLEGVGELKESSEKEIADAQKKHDAATAKEEKKSDEKEPDAE